MQARVSLSSRYDGPADLLHQRRKLLHDGHSQMKEAKRLPSFDISYSRSQFPLDILWILQSVLEVATDLSLLSTKEPWPMRFFL